MPKASVQENGLFPFHKNQIGFSGKFIPVSIPIMMAKIPKQMLEFNFWFRILILNQGHLFSAFFLCHVICHRITTITDIIILHLQQ